MVRNSQKIYRQLAVITLITILALSSAACGKKDLVRTTSDAITALRAGLEIADSAHRSGFLADAEYRGTLGTGAVANTILGEVNEFAAKFPEDGTSPTEEQKQFVLGRINDALARLDNLIADGVLIKDPEGQRRYLTKVRQAKALVTGLADAIKKIEAAKPKPTTSQTVGLPVLLRV